jgi:signal transduction histidine kinase
MSQRPTSARRSGLNGREPIEVGAYHVVSGELANAAKHSQASAVHADVEPVKGVLPVCVGDDGAGGANPSRSGLMGLKDRVEALGGGMSLHSPHGPRTSLTVELQTA